MHDLEEVSPLLQDKKRGLKSTMLNPTNARGPAELNQSFWLQLRTFVKIAIPFFREDRMALCSLVGLVVLTILANGISVLFSYVRSWMMDALNDKDESLFWKYIEYFFACLVIAVPITVFYTYMRANLALRWRRGFTKRVLDLYYKNKTFYILEMSRDVEQDKYDNPDQRIADDINQFTSTSLTFFFIVLDAVVNLVSFSIVLYQIFPMLFLAIIVYAGMGTYITAWMGKPLISLYYEQMKKEANFRFGLIRTRENAESISFYDPTCREEQAVIWTLFEQALSVQFNIIWVQRNLQVFTNSFDYLAFVVPYVVVAPLYFAGSLPLGSVTQAAEAFWNVRSDLSIIVSYFEDLSLFAAGLARLHNFVRRVEDGGWGGTENEDREGGGPQQGGINKSTEMSSSGNSRFGIQLRVKRAIREGSNLAVAALATSPASTTTTLSHSHSDAGSPQNNLSRIVLSCFDLTIATPDLSRLLVGGLGLEPADCSSTHCASLETRGVTFTVREGDRLLITGPSGCGKSSLLRVLAGLWVSGYGRIEWYVRGSKKGDDNVDISSSSSSSSISSSDDDDDYDDYDDDDDDNSVHDERDKLKKSPRHSTSSPKQAAGRRRRLPDTVSSSNVFFLPQRPYNQLTSLRQAVKYPMSGEMFADPVRNDDIIERILDRVSLGNLPTRFGLDSVHDWSKVLSSGEQQRLAFARVLYNRPQVVVADEATSALDKETEALMFGVLKELGVTYICVGHDKSLLAHHNKIIRLRGPGRPLQMEAL